MLVLPPDSPQPFLGRKYLPNDLYNTHRPPLCRALLTVQFAGVIEGATDFLLHPLYCANYQAIYQTWQAMRKSDKALCVAFKFCTRPGYFGKRLQKVGPEPSSSLLSLSTKGFATFIMMEQYLFSCFNYPFLLICVIWPEMQIGLFYNLDVAHNKNSLENGPNWACIIKNSVNRQECICLSKFENLAVNVGIKFQATS